MASDKDGWIFTSGIDSGLEGLLGHVTAGCSKPPTLIGVAHTDEYESRVTDGKEHVANTQEGGSTVGLERQPQHSDRRRTL